MFEFENFNLDSSTNFRAEIVEQKFQRATQAIRQSLELTQRTQTLQQPEIVAENVAQQNNQQIDQQQTTQTPTGERNLILGCY